MNLKRNKIVCYDCGVELIIRQYESIAQVYDMERELWVDECPSCEGSDFHEKGEEYVSYFY